MNFFTWFLFFKNQAPIERKSLVEFKTIVFFILLSPPNLPEVWAKEMFFFSSCYVAACPLFPNILYTRIHHSQLKKGYMT